MSEQTATSTPTPKRRRFRIFRILVLLAIVLAVLIAAAPWIVAHTPLRDQAINTVLASPSVTAESESASFGWFSPLAVHGLHLNSTNSNVDIRLEDITAERSLLDLWSSAPDLGTINVEKVHVNLKLPLDVQLKGASHRLVEPTFKAVVKNAALTVRLAGHDDPVIDVDGINMTFRVEKEGEGRVLTLDPIVLFDRRKVSPQLASKMLHHFDPTLSGTPEISGAFSLSLAKLRIPIGVPKDQAVKQIEMEGKLVLHEVSTEVKSPLQLALVRLVADMNGKESSDVVHLAQNDEIRFQLRDGRLHHEGLRIGFPDIDPQLALTSHGWVGLDKTLDLVVELPRLDPALRKEKGPAKCHVTGTIGNPKISVDDGSLVLRQHGHKHPILYATGINLRMQVEKTAAGHVLAVEPVEVFKERKLELGIAGGLLNLISPDVRSERDITGEISLSFSKLRIPLGLSKDQAAKQMEAEGKVKLHRVSSKIESPLWQGLIRLLADMNGKEPPKAIQIVEDSEIRFQIRDGRLHHEGQRIGFPDIDPGLEVTSRGSVGVDKTLDLFVELPRLDPALRKEKGPAKCHITGTIDNPKITVEDGSLIVRQHEHKEPIIYASGINLSLQVENTATGHVLAVEPVEVFKNRKLSLGIAGGLLDLVAPDVHSEREITGDISLSLSKLRVPVGLPRNETVKQMQAEGKLTLHQVSSEIQSPMWQGLVRLIADISGKKSPKVIRLVEDSEIQFQMRDGRLHHQGQRIGFPDIDPQLVVGSSGSVGLDESLDLRLELPRLRKELRGNGPLKCQVTGTMKKPNIAIKDASLVVHLNDDDKSALTVDNVDLNFGVEKSKDGLMLTMAPVTVLKKQKLTPEVGDDLLRLAVPTLTDLADVQGEFSLSFDNFGIPLGVPKDEFAKKVLMTGKLQLHDISVTIKTPLLQTVVKVLADRYGKKPSDVVRVVQNAEVHFKVENARMYHEGLRFGFPDISPDLLISSRGYVGYDKSLDFVLDVPRILLGKKDPTKFDPVRLRVTGTIDKPIVKEVPPDKGK
jgi:hypothetical protein